MAMLSDNRARFAMLTDLRDCARAIQRQIHKLRKPAQQFAYNLIEQCENDILTREPVGTHRLQQPAEKVRIQVDRLEQALKQG